jgi:hypothetical protein
LLRNLLNHREAQALRERSTPKLPTEVEIRDGQVYRWTR